MTQSLDDHLANVASAFSLGRVVPFLGAGVNLCCRPAKTKWELGCSYLPNGGELALHLAEKYRYPAADAKELARVSQYISTINGSGPLYEDLHDLLDADYSPTPVHHFLAALPGIMRERGYPRRPIPRFQLLLVTTNYDDLLERAFVMAKQPFDLVAYVAEGKHRGKFWHWAAEEEPRWPLTQAPQLIDRPNEYLDVSLEVRPVILKIHGAVSRVDPSADSFVITEDHYIDYLTRTDISNLLPATLGAELRSSHFLFLGYGLRDWNLRVILHRIWSQQVLDFKSWAVQRTVAHVEEEYWRKWNVDIRAVLLEDYIAGLTKHVDALETVKHG